MKLFIESIEGGTYLAAVGENNNQCLVRDNNDKAVAFSCIEQIKLYFVNTEFEQVWLKQTTPYDEMCGADENQEKLKMQINWH